MIRLMMTGLLVMAGMIPARAEEKPRPTPAQDKGAACERCNCCGEDSQATSRVFELRTYYLNEGKLDDLHKRFRDHTCRLLRKHGAELIGFWTPLDEKDGKGGKLIYLVAFPSREAAKKTWAAFSQDPEWQKVREESHKNGVLVKRVESIFLEPTDYSAMK
ncbi:MAG TPA: NIPSNAP family protein [Isosphaeraceae bacterium]|nr:NIPSNAP family protein [Isosphaeraceae bacterium]